MAFREFEAACEQNPTCSLQKALARLKCVRECISPICYQQIYYQDQVINYTLILKEFIILKNIVIIDHITVTYNWYYVYM